MTVEGSPLDDRGLLEVLEQSEQLGFIGGSDLPGHISHARAFAAIAGGVPRRVLDLGSGGGLPGLVLAFVWPDAEVVLLDGSATRASFLDEAVDELDLAPRVRAIGARAEEAGRDPALRGSFDLVVSRSFGPPAIVAECAAPFLELDGALIVSEPRVGGSRWDHPTELDELGLVVAGDVERTAVGSFQILRQASMCPERYPRRTGIPSKRPLFT